MAKDLAQIAKTKGIKYFSNKLCRFIWSITRKTSPHTRY